MSAAIALFLSLGAGRAHRRAAPHVLGVAPLAEGRGVELTASTSPSPTRRISTALKAGVAAEPTRLVWLETPSNPLWSVTDIAAAAGIAHGAGATLAVDFDLRDAGFHPAARARRRRRHAFGDQVSQRPLRRRRRRARLRPRRTVSLRARAEIRKLHGLILGPFEAFLLIRGLRTLDLRVRAAAANAFDLAQTARLITPRSPRCSIPACPTIPATQSPSGRCRAASAACCRSGCAAARRRDRRRRRGRRSGSARLRSAASSR